MSKGLYRVFDAHNNRSFSIYPSEDVEKSVAFFEEEVLAGKRFPRYKYKERLRAEVLEKTDFVAERYAFYTWPQLSRLKYSQECLSRSLNPRFSTTVRNSVDWLVGTFQDAKYTFEIFVSDEELKANVFENGRPFERYTFTKKTGEPTAREFVD